MIDPFAGFLEGVLKKLYQADGDSIKSALRRTRANESVDGLLHPWRFNRRLTATPSGVRIAIH